jgi:hypothetical protein
MGRQTVELVQVVGPEAPVQAGPEALGGLGRVLGDVAGHLLSRQLSRLVVGSGDVADVELLAPADIPIRAVPQGWAGHPDSRDGLPQGILEEGRREAGRWWGQAAGTAALGGRVQTQDGVEVDRSAPLELGHLGIGDPHQPA